MRVSRTSDSRFTYAASCAELTRQRLRSERRRLYGKTPRTITLRRLYEFVGQHPMLTSKFAAICRYSRRGGHPSEVLTDGGVGTRGGAHVGRLWPRPDAPTGYGAGSPETTHQGRRTVRSGIAQTARQIARTHQGRIRPARRSRAATAGDRHPDHLGWGGLGSLRGGVSQGVAEDSRPAPTRQTRIRCRDRGEHRHADRAVRILGRRNSRPTRS